MPKIMKKDLKEYLNYIEHLEYDERLPIHASLFENKAMLSKFIWDIHSHNAKKFYILQNKKYNSELEKRGYITGNLNKNDTALLKNIYLSCKKEELDPFDFDFNHVYEPRKNLHDDMVRINNYFHPSDFFFENMLKILNPLKDRIEKENQYYWKVASCRIFEVKPVIKAQGFHKDDQALAVKKLFFYPEGANKKVGSTIIIDKKGNENLIELNPGSWMLFENSLCEHQAYSSSDCSGRPTIEIDIMPDFYTDTKLRYRGVNGWYPWFPIEESALEINGNLNYNEIFERNLRRISGLCSINTTDSYRFPCEFSDYHDQNYEVFKKRNNEEKVYLDTKTEINDIVNRNGLISFLSNLILVLPLIILRKIIGKLMWKK